MRCTQLRGYGDFKRSCHFFFLNALSRFVRIHETVRLTVRRLLSVVRKIKKSQAPCRTNEYDVRRQWYCTWFVCVYRYRKFSVFFANSTPIPFGYSGLLRRTFSLNVSEICFTKKKTKKKNSIYRPQAKHSRDGLAAMRSWKQLASTEFNEVFFSFSAA